LKTESYEYGGKTVTRIAGDKAGIIMLGYRKARDNYPQLLENLEVYSQPAACADSIIMTWMMEAQAEAFPCTLWVRDMLAAGAGTVRQAATLSGQMLGHIQGGTTCLVQTTDTNMSHSFNRDLDQNMKSERLRFKTIARRNGLPYYYFHCGPLQVLTIVAEAHAKHMERQRRDPWALNAHSSNCSSGLITAMKLSRDKKQRVQAKP
jgi:hypothetical protein